MGASKSDVMIIAEAGVNHNGSLAVAEKLALEAKKAGADIVKYQVYKADRLVSSSAEKASYQKESTEVDETQLEMLKRLELTFDEFRQLKDYCDSIGIAFLATSFDEESTRFIIEDLDVPFIKIPSGEIDNYPFLTQVAKSGKPIVMSTGMASIDEVACAIDLLHENGTTDLTLLHCNTQYPTPFEDVNLRAMCSMGEAFNVPFGYSDHTDGIEVPIAAVAMGARIIEKHFTLDRSQEGPDHRASLDSAQLEKMVRSIRNIEKALGSPEKRITSSESENRSIARKSIVASCPIHAGEMLTEDNLTVKRPGTGLSPMLWNDVIGKFASRDFLPDEEIEF